MLALDSWLRELDTVVPVTASLDSGADRIDTPPSGNAADSEAPVESKTSSRTADEPPTAPRSSVKSAGPKKAPSKVTAAKSTVTKATRARSPEARSVGAQSTDAKSAGTKSTAARRTTAKSTGAKKAVSGVAAAKGAASSNAALKAQATQRTAAARAARTASVKKAASSTASAKATMKTAEAKAAADKTVAAKKTAGVAVPRAAAAKKSTAQKTAARNAGESTKIASRRATESKVSTSTTPTTKKPATSRAKNVEAAPESVLPEPVRSESTLTEAPVIDAASQEDVSPPITDIPATGAQLPDATETASDSLSTAASNDSTTSTEAEQPREDRALLAATASVSTASATPEQTGPAVITKTPEITRTSAARPTAAAAAAPAEPADQIEPAGAAEPSDTATEADPASTTAATAKTATDSSPGEFASGASSTEADAVRIRGLVKRFGDSRAVDGIDLTVPAGSFYGLVGPNGAGKTTTLSIIAGLLRPDEGTVHIAGIDQRKNPLAAKRVMGVLPDRLRTFDRLTGRQLLHYYGQLRGISRPVIEKRVGDLARAFDLTMALGRVVSDYSAGMTKKLMLAGALIHSPRVLVLDEPFEAVDPVSSGVILDILRAYVTHGGTVILSSHGMDLVEQVCSRVAVIVGGDVLVEGTIDDVRAGQTLTARFVELSGAGGEVEGLEWLHTFSS